MVEFKLESDLSLLSELSSKSTTPSALISQKEKQQISFLPIGESVFNLLKYFLLRLYQDEEYNVVFILPGFNHAIQMSLESYKPFHYVSIAQAKY